MNESTKTVMLDREGENSNFMVSTEFLHTYVNFETNGKMALAESGRMKSETE